MRRRLSIVAFVAAALAAQARPALAESSEGDAKSSARAAEQAPSGAANVQPGEARSSPAPPSAPLSEVVAPALGEGAPPFGSPLLAGVAAPPSLRLGATPMLTVNIGPSATNDRRERTPFYIAGGLCLGFGVAALFASGVTWLVAASASARLDNECPNRICVEGTPGGDAYETTRDGLRGADILAGVGFPLVGTGIVMFVFSAAVGKRGSMAASGPTVTAGPGGANLKLRF